MGNDVVSSGVGNGGDSNRSRRIEAVEALRKALDEASSSGLTGTVAVEVTCLHGNLARIKVTSVRFEN